MNARLSAEDGGIAWRLQAVCPAEFPDRCRARPHLYRLLLPCWQIALKRISAIVDVRGGQILLVVFLDDFVRKKET
ncbi:hypothetical protein SIAM614_06363 [Stappia aggregata IAM 12614]|uniref:Uncharacterized protein n=1 Tax=Roseibium aggregatum (strain ATCC 25650 / DSM 13394 / JCM 20685 / NBRC 16684 / NCIMB 2208 / IAM 12614 / B1) TaxID=384765 RepID=A0NVB8_ROSAI|nr:hypothetical protein SIAM614_06363 [Stappia aggregata IAM 12614] [Roseibium aggregatum IAM 12614]